MPLCSQPFFLKRFSRAPFFFFWGGITHTQTVWVLRKPSGFQETSLCLSSGLLLDPPSGLCDVRLWPFQRNAMIQKSCSWRTWRNANWWFEQQPKKSVENKQTIGWCVEKNTKKALVFTLFLCVRKVDYITTSFKNQHGTSHGDLIWIVSLFLRILTKIPGGFHTSWTHRRGHAIHCG